MYSLDEQLAQNPNTSVIIMALLKKLGGEVRLSTQDLISVMPPVKWNIEKSPITGELILRLK